MVCCILLIAFNILLYWLYLSENIFLSPWSTIDERNTFCECSFSSLHVQFNFYFHFSITCVNILDKILKKQCFSLQCFITLYIYYYLSIIWEPLAKAEVCNSCTTIVSEMQTDILRHSLCLPLVRQTDRPAPNSRHWLRQCCCVVLVTQTCSVTH